MANIHGKNTAIYVEDSLAACQSLSVDGNSVTMTESDNHPEITGFGDAGTQRSASSIGYLRLSYEAFASDTATSGNLEVLNEIKGRVGLISWGPNGSATGNVKYSASMILDDYEITAPVAGIVTARGTFSLASGSLTKATW